MIELTGSEKFCHILKDVKYKNWEFLIEENDKGTPYLVIAFNDEKGESWRSRKWMLSEHMTESEIVQTAFFAVKTAEEHETREQFLWMDRAIFGPHVSIEAMWERANSLDVRAEPTITI